MSNDDLSKEDKQLFRAAMRSVKPLKNKTLRESISKPAPKIPRNLQNLSTHQLPAPIDSDYFLSDCYHEVVQAETRLSYTCHSIPKKRLKQLQNGQIPLEGRLDLHGLKPDAARASFCHFISQQSQLHHRCVLIIHGKGGRQGEAPVLKNLVYYWLQQLPNILAFHSALPQDGGVGALYVLLKSI
jgi:DNA-nicking Smr family endonuclease